MLFFCILCFVLADGFMSGAVQFLISDALLIHNRIRPDSWFRLHIENMSVHYPGQLLIAAGQLLVP